MYSVTQQSVVISGAAPRHEITHQNSSVWMNDIDPLAVCWASVMVASSHSFFSLHHTPFSFYLVWDYKIQLGPHLHLKQVTDTSYFHKGLGNRWTENCSLFFNLRNILLSNCFRSAQKSCINRWREEKRGDLFLQPWPPGVQQSESLNEIFKASVLSAVCHSRGRKKASWRNAPLWLALPERGGQVTSAALAFKGIIKPQGSTLDWLLHIVINHC